MTDTDSEHSFEARRPSRMEALPGDPWLKVHAIAEFVFCPRAGLLAHENQQDVQEAELPAFDILPKYELAAIERALVELREKVIRDICIFAALTLSAPMATLVHQYWLVVLIALGMLFYSHRILTRVGDGIVLLRRRHTALRSTCFEPDPDPDPSTAKMEPVNWFGMLNLGFDSVKLQEPLRDPRWQLEGAPWRILRKGSLSIPVFQTRGDLERPHDQHFAKIMAYCRLVEVSENVPCPYGIVLTGPNYEGFAVPNVERFRKDFHNQLLQLRQLVHTVDKIEVEPPAPIDTGKCEFCPLGKPRPVRQGKRVQRLGAPLPVVVMTDARSRALHCDCGDRFRWKPPHRANRYLS